MKLVYSFLESGVTFLTLMSFFFFKIQYFLQRMIIEPQFPQSFCRFLSAIVTRELETDLAKAKLSPSSTSELFAALDSHSSGTFFLQDLYIFLKKRGVNANKKELKFINKYFGFSRTERLTLEDFQRCFLQIRNPRNGRVEKGSNQLQCLAEMIEVVIEGYCLIEEERQKAAKDAEELKTCLARFYQDDVGIITRDLLREVLISLNLYSRLNFALLCNYVIGEDAKEVSIKQLFLFEGSFTNEATLPTRELSATSDFKQNRKLLLGSTPQESKLASSVGSFKFKSQSTDILLQIENIQSAIKQKKEMYSQRKKQLEDESSKKPVGMLMKRPSVTQLKPTTTREVQQLQIETNENLESRYTIREEKPFDQSILANINLSRQNSKQKYSFADAVEEERDTYESRDIDQLLRSRMPSKNREETLTKASSCARLKIQEIERRVMGRVGQRAAATKAQEYISRIPSDLRMNSSELRSRYSSLTRN